MKKPFSAITSHNENLTNFIEYSTNEVAIGKWIDGKTIYRRVVSFTTTSSNNTKVNIPTTIPNVETIVSISGYLLQTNNSVWLPFNSYYNASYNLYMGFSMNDKQIEYKLVGADAYASRPAFAIVEYTKA